VPQIFAQQELAYGKTKANYEFVFGKFVKFFNNEQSDSIINITSDTYTESDKMISWSVEQIKNEKEELGSIISYKYIGPYGGRIDVDGNPMAYFKLVFDKPAKMKGEKPFDFPEMNGKKEHAACISLDKEGKIYGWGFITSSPDIDSMISRY